MRRINMNRSNHTHSLAFLERKWCDRYVRCQRASRASQLQKSEQTPCVIIFDDKAIGYSKVTTRLRKKKFRNADAVCACP